MAPSYFADRSVSECNLFGALPTQGLNPVSCVSCIGRRIPYHRATWEPCLSATARWNCFSVVKFISLCFYGS